MSFMQYQNVIALRRTARSNLILIFVISERQEAFANRQKDAAEPREAIYDGRKLLAIRKESSHPKESMPIIVDMLSRFDIAQ